MKTPAPEMLIKAADELDDANPTDMPPALALVVRWLRELAAEQEIEAMIRKQCAALGASESLTPAMMRKIKRQLVAKYGKPTEAISSPSVPKP